MKKLIILIFVSFSLLAQNPGINKAEAGKICFLAKTIHVGDGTIVEAAYLIMENGKILALGSGAVPASFNITKTIDLGNQSIYPGLISPNNSLGLTEIEAVRTTHDYQELGQINPNVRTFIAYNTDSEVIPTVRSNGVLHTQATPEGGLISGRSSIFNLDGWNYEDAALLKDDGIWVNWPSKITTSFNFTDFSREKKKNENYQSQVIEISNYFDRMESAIGESKVKDNLKISAISSLSNSNIRLYIRFDTDREAFDAISFIKKYKIKYPVLVGELSSDLLIDLLTENKIPIIIPSTHRLPALDDDDIWEAYKLPSRLMAKGILVGMHYNDSYWRTRNLGFVAGNAAGHGLSKEQALSMITLNNAKIMGIDKMVGTIAVGKNASFVVSEGDLLDMKTAKVTKAYINGASVSLDDKQKRLANKYQAKYNIK